MQYKRTLFAWLTAMLLCAAVAAALGSCGGSGKGTGLGGGGDAGTDDPVTTIADAVARLLACGFTGQDALTRRLAIDFSVANKRADGVVFPPSAERYFERFASAYLGCLVVAPCTELAGLYCEGALAPEWTLSTCFDLVERKYAGQAPGSTFTCADKTALEKPSEAVCDGTPNCADGSDETSKACALVEHIECDGRSAPDEWRCNSDAQCKDGADEANCFVCSESEVTASANRCNGSFDCGSGIDEEGCGESFGCPPAPTQDAGTEDAGEDDAGEQAESEADASEGDASLDDAATDAGDAGT